MRLSTAAAFFDKTLCADAFDSGTTFYGQMDVYDDSKRDGATVVRRVLSVAPGTTIPARRVLTIDGEQWIVGANQVDRYSGAPLRDKYVMHRASGAASLQSVDQLLSSGGVSTYGSRLWVKDLKEVEISSKLAAFFNVYLSTYETVTAGSVISLGGRVHMVRNFFTSAAGFLVAESDELATDAVASGTYTPRSYAPATDALADGAPVVANVLKVRYQDSYAYANQGEARYEEGDFRAFVRKAAVASAKRGDKLALSGVTHDVLSVSDEGLCWGLHLRHA